MEQISPRYPESKKIHKRYKLLGTLARHTKNTKRGTGNPAFVKPWFWYGFKLPIWSMHLNYHLGKAQSKTRLASDLRLKSRWLGILGGTLVSTEFL